MRVENLVFDVADPERECAFWSGALGARRTTAEADGHEARLELPGGFWLDLCFQRVLADRPSGPRQTRLHLDLPDRGERQRVLDELTALGASPADIGQGVPDWEVLADPEGNVFCVVGHPVDDRTGPIAALPLDSADPERDAGFWAAISGWVPHRGEAPAGLRHPGGFGPPLEFWPEEAPKHDKLLLHLDVRGEAGDPDLVELALDLGATRLVHDWGDHPWTVLNDPSGNEFCVLDPETAASS